MKMLQISHLEDCCGNHLVCVVAANTYWCGSVDNEPKQVWDDQWLPVRVWMKHKGKA